MMKSSAQPDRPTMETVARVAGVSKITVSRALRGSDLFRPEVRTRIAEAAKQVGYRMNVAARQLRTRRSQTIAVVVEQLSRGDRPITDPLLLSIIGGLLEALTPLGYAMLLTTRDHFLASNAMGADGIVLIGEGEGGAGLSEIGSFELPTVAWGEPIPGINFTVIGSDNLQGGRLAAEHLVTTGRKRLLFLGDAEHPEVAARLAGAREVLASSDAVLAAVVACPFTIEGGANAIRDSLESGRQFDSVLAVSDFIAAGACDALLARKIRVPGDVAVVGFDDTPIAAAHRPSLTSVRQDGVIAGQSLGKAIVNLVEGTSSPIAMPLPVELIIRESSS
jgi:DNA-binding LacI/PurR family transcriptional regulator